MVGEGLSSWDRLRGPHWCDVVVGSGYRPSGCGDARWVDGDGSGFSTWSYSPADPADPTVPAGGTGWDRSWTTRVPPSWPPAGSPGPGVADAAFTAAREWFPAAPPATEYLHPVRVDRDGDDAVLVFRSRADPRRFAIRVQLPTRTEPVDDGWGAGVVWGVPGVQTGLMAPDPVAWADELHGLLEEELLTGSMRGPTRRDRDLVVVDLANRGTGDTDRSYYLSSGTWGRVVNRRLHVNQESVPPAEIIRKAGFPTGELVAAGRAGSLVAWMLVWVNTASGGPLVGQCSVAPPMPGSPPSTGSPPRPRWNPGGSPTPPVPAGSDSTSDPQGATLGPVVGPRSAGMGYPRGRAPGPDN